MIIILGLVAIAGVILCVFKDRIKWCKKGRANKTRPSENNQYTIDPDTSARQAVLQ